jgi:chromosome partitioning protein
VNIIAVSCHKGGVSKSSLSTSIAAALAERPGRRVLICDLDPQSSQSSALRIRPEAGRTLAEVLRSIEMPVGHPTKVTMTDIIVPTSIANLDLAPSLDTLGPAAVEAASNDPTCQQLVEMLAPLEGAYTDIVIDTPTPISPLGTMALIAATQLIVPITPASEGARRGLQTIERARKVQGDGKRGLNPDLKILGILPTQVPANTLFARDILETLGKRATLITPFVPRTTAVPEATAAGVSILEWTKGESADSAPGRAAAAYRSLASLVIETGAKSEESEVA